MFRQALGSVVVAGSLMAGASAEAHHSTAGVYDPGKEVTVKGALPVLLEARPHSVKKATGRRLPISGMISHYPTWLPGPKQP